MKGQAIVYFLTIFLLSTTTSALAKPQLLASVEVEQLMRNSFSMRTLLAAEAQPARTAKADTTLMVRSAAGAVSFTPSQLVLTAGQRLTVQLHGVAAEGVEVYPRHPDIVAWGAADSSLAARQAGDTEVIFIIAKTLYILPLQVQAAAVAKLEVKPAPEVEPVVEPVLEVEPPVAQRASAAPRQATSKGRFQLEQARTAPRSVEIQVVDERTTAEARYPVSGMQVSLLGSPTQLHTDARGIVRLTDVPDAARLLFRLHDPQGRYVPALQEVFVQQPQARYQLTVQRDISFTTMQTIVGRSQDARLASLCAVIEGGSSESGFKIESDVPADGAYYFNQLQLLAPRQQATGSNNRFCLFNIDPGPLTLFVNDADGQRRAVFTVGLAAGHHSEEVFRLTEGPPYRSWLAVANDMHRPLHGQDTGDIVDFVQMRIIGDSRYWAKVEPGLLETAQAPDWHRGRSYAVTRDAEFEDTLYQFTDRVGLVPLLIRGFIENTALLAEAVHDATLGSVVIEHGARQGEDAAAVSLRLVGTDGEEVRATWAVQEDGVTRSVFLNLGYGVYQAIAQNSAGNWLAAGTVVVYNETVSFLRTGATVVYGKAL